MLPPMGCVVLLCHVAAQLRRRPSLREWPMPVFPLRRCHGRRTLRLSLAAALTWCVASWAQAADAAAAPRAAPAASATAIQCPPAPQPPTAEQIAAAQREARDRG